MKSDKRTKGLVPKLRFPEFRDAPEWKIERLSKISSRVIRKVGDLKVPTLSISAGKGFVTQTEKFGRNISGAQYKNYILLEKGDFAYNKGNSKQYPQGCIYQLEQFDEAAVPNAFICFCFRKNYVAKFFLFYFENNCYGEQLKRYITSGARSDGLLNISADDFFSILIPVSEIREEQQKIADCLSSIDGLIKLHSQKLELLKDYKKGLLQHLFPTEGEAVPKLRFPEFKNAPEWVEDPLSKYLIESRILGSRGDVAKKLTVKLWGRGVFEKEEVLKGSPSTQYYRRRTGQFIYSKLDFLNQAFGIIPNDLDGYESTADLPCFDLRKGIHPIFLLEYVKRDVFFKKFGEIADGGRKAKRIQTDILLSFPIFVPCSNEQQKIADCLSSTDELITSQTRKIESLKEHKKGLMQQLFPSVEEVNV